MQVNDVRFISHPTLMPSSSSSFLVNIVFALYAQASYSVVKCYYELSKKIGYLLYYEENRTGYLSDEIRLMLKAHDEITAMEEHADNTSSPKLSRFDLVLERCTLAQALKTCYYDLCQTGLLNITINHGVSLSFCLPQKAHQFHKKGIVEPEAIDNCLKSLKPYHGMLLLVDALELLDCVPPCGARMLFQLLEIYNPLKSLQNMSSDADLQIDHVFCLVGHLVYWAKATIIYPLCETNVYVIAPDAPLHIGSPLIEKFATKFPGMSLFEVISDFSLPTSIGHLTTPLQHPARQGRLAQMVLWMLQHHLLMQLHTYVQFMQNQGYEGAPIEHHFETDPIFPQSISYQQEQTETFSGSTSEPMNVPLVVNRRTNYDAVGGDNNGAGGAVGGGEVVLAGPSTSHKSNYSTTHSVSLSDNAEESLASVEDEEKIKELLMAFEEPDRTAVRRISAASNAEDLGLMVKLWQMGYFKGEHHLEEIMYFENLRRSQLLQLLDKFREVLIIYETEDPVISLLFQPEDRNR